MRYYDGKAIREWAEEDQPREKMMSRGPGALTDAELLSILIGTGNYDYSALDVGRLLLEEFGSLLRLSRASAQELMKVPAIGKAKALALQASFELHRRKEMYESARISYRSSRDIARIARPLIGDLNHEAFLAMFFNSNLELLGKKIIHVGGVDACIVDPKVVYKEAVNFMATQIVVAHNHPSGNERPSRQDVIITNKLREAGELLDIKLLDHLIFGKQDKFYSFADSGFIEPFYMDTTPGPTH